MSSTGGSEDAGRDLCLRLTSRRVPENAAQKDRTGLPFGVTVHGYDEYVSYGYPAGLNVTNLSSP